MSNEQVNDIEDVLGAVQKSTEGDRVSVRDMLNAVGQRAYGPILLTLGLIAVSPIGGIPGVPTVLASIVFLISVQIVFSPRSLWLPKFLLKRSVESSKIEKSVSVLQKPARFVDKIIRPRLTVLTRGVATPIIGVTCMLLAVSVPVIELVPFAGYIPASAFVAFGLALTAHDGVLAALAFALTAGAFYFVFVTLL